MASRQINIRNDGSASLIIPAFTDGTYVHVELSKEEIQQIAEQWQELQIDGPS